MSKKRFSIRAIVITVVITFLLTGGVGLLAARHLIGSGGLAVLESMGLIRSRFIADYEKDIAVDEALRGMVDALGDRWSHYLSAEERAQMERTRANAYVGIGITYQRSEDPVGMRVVEVVEEGPAAEAGIKVGELITAVNGQRLTKEEFDGQVAQIGDEAGTLVTLGVQGIDGSEREIELTLRRVEDAPVKQELLDGEIGYIRIENFYQNCADSAKKAVEDLTSRGAKTLLFDMRANPGGYVSEMTELLDYLLPEGPIFAEHSKKGKVNVINSDESCVDLPMAVLVDENTYSAAEMFAAQLRESVGAKIIGTKTCGKGYYQQGFPLSNGGMLSISTGAYTTGGGVSLIGVGVTPDYTVTGAEAQMDKAVEVLREKMKEG